MRVCVCVCLKVLGNKNGENDGTPLDGRPSSVDTRRWWTGRWTPHRRGSTAPSHLSRPFGEGFFFYFTGFFFHLGVGSPSENGACHTRNPTTEPFWVLWLFLLAVMEFFLLLFIFFCFWIKLSSGFVVFSSGAAVRPMAFPTCVPGWIGLAAGFYGLPRCPRGFAERWMADGRWVMSETDTLISAAPHPPYRCRDRPLRSNAK